MCDPYGVSGVSCRPPKHIEHTGRKRSITRERNKLLELRTGCNCRGDQEIGSGVSPERESCGVLEVPPESCVKRTM